MHEPNETFYTDITVNITIRLETQSGVIYIHKHTHTHKLETCNLNII